MIVTELRWAWCRAARSRFGKSGANESPLQQLRRLLRSDPVWLKGHILLGEYALAAYEVDQRSSILRHLATVRSTTKAIVALAENSSPPQARHALVVARYFEAMIAFHEKQFEDALHQFETMLQAEELQLLSKQQVRRGVESAAAAALALDDRERAKRLFNLLPSELQSGVGEIALRYISGEEEKESNIS